MWYIDKKKKILFLSIWIFFFSLNSFSQNTLENSNNNDSISIGRNTEFDIMIKNNGERLYVKIADVLEKQIRFVYPGENQIRAISRSEIKDIIYKLKKEETKTNNTNTLLKSTWRKVIVTKDEEDVQGLTKMGEIIGVAKGSKRGYSTAESLERNAIVIIRKKAFALNADVVLIVNKKIYQAFGDIPKTTLNGIAYSSQ